MKRVRPTVKRATYSIGDEVVQVSTRRRATILKVYSTESRVEYQLTYSVTSEVSIDYINELDIKPSHYAAEYVKS